MTPSAITPAARGARRKPASAASGGTAEGERRRKAPTSSQRSGGHATKVGRQTAPRAPRRVSGPLSGRTRKQTAATTTAPARVRAPRRPASRQASGTPLLARSVAFVRALPDHSLLDRIVRGRAWIPLIGILLAGIVAMQVEVLKLNAGIGRSVVRGSALQSQNALLRAQVATLADDQRIESKAAQMGMVMPAPGSIKFLSLGNTVALQRALTSFHQPDASAFTSDLTAAGLGPSSASSASTGSASVTPAATSSGAASVDAASSGVASTGATPAAAPTTTTPDGSSTGSVAP
jgi:cell division protein FtsL